MKKYHNQLLFCLTFLFLNFQVQAENTLGGTLDFTHKGGNTYTVKATIYVDKSVNGTSPDLYKGFIPAKIYSKGSTAAGDVFVQTINISFFSRKDDFPYENQECASSVSISTTKIVYSSDITLDKSRYTNPNGYYIVCIDGNRNATTNANTPSVGMTMYLEFPALNVTDNSSPVFNLKKGYIACVNKQLVDVDLSASDADAGDTRTYRLVNPYSGAGGANKQSFASSIVPRNSGFTNGPSYDNGFVLVPFKAGFSATNPITGTGINLNSRTGELTGIPTKIGKYLVCVECREFRNGVPIGLNRQDFEIIVDDCTNPKPKIFLSGNDPTIHEVSAVICEGSFRILETVNNANFTYVWKKNGVVVAGANKYQLKVLDPDAGKYTVTVTRTGSSCAGTETSLETELNPQGGENVKLTVADSTVCSDAVPVILNIEQNSMGVARNNFTKEWYINETIITEAGGKQSYPVSASGKYKVVVTDFTTGSSKCTYEAFQEIIVTPVPKPTITNLTGKTAVCQGDIVKLSVAPIETDVTYHWVRNSVDIASTTTLDVNSSGIYTIRGESTVNPSCVSYAPTTVNIAVNPYPTVTFDEIKPVCNTTSGKVDLRNLVNPYDPVLGVFTGTGVRGYEFDPTISGYGSFPIKYTYTLAGCGKDASKTAIVDLSPVVKLGNDLTIFRGDTIRLKSVGSTGSKYFYEWTPTTNLNSPNIPQPVANPDVTTEYVVKVSSILGKCTATDKILITVKSILKIPAAFTPNNDTINDTWAIMDNNREYNDYPDIEVKIFNRWGGEIFYSIGSGSYQTKPFDGIQDGQRLPAGSYFYVIKPSPDVPSLTGYVTIVR